MIALSDVRKHYRLGPVTAEVLRGVSLEARRSEMLSIMGPTGCGKSTLMNIIGLMDRASSGAYLLDGEDVGGLDDDARARARNARIGFVFQAFHLLPRMTAAENVALPLVYRSLAAHRARAAAAEALDRVGMADRAGHRPAQLSGGQQQRVALARVLVGAPAVILADEPTGALDPETSAAIMDLLEGLCRERRMTVVIVTHDPQVARRCARRTRMAHGVLREEGAP